MLRTERGFTLLEIIIALAIAVLGIAAVAKATGGAATVAAETRERMLAVWVAGNRLSELRITRAWPAPGSADMVRSMGGRTWYLTQTVSGTPDEDLRRVDLAVYTDADRDEREFEAYGYLARYRSAEELGGGPEAGEGELDQEPPPDDEGGTPLPGEEEPPADGEAPDEPGDAENT